MTYPTAPLSSDTARYAVNQLGRDYFAVRDLVTECDVAVRSSRAAAEARLAELQTAAAPLPDALTRVLTDARDCGETIVCEAIGEDMGRTLLYLPRHLGDDLPWVIACTTRRYASHQCSIRAINSSD
ncbi:hypothetical protein [Streptacidiphilus sp. EB103A]|uniref:hypothetical protein n=1 Tax=Streptacidiphilus sp. EB103A TaxID=3156275 RepID=UPI003511AC1B